MISVTNDIKTFLEKETGEVYIYGAGNAGYWIGYYMNKCGIEFNSYIDKYIEKEGVRCNDHYIYGLEKLRENSRIHIRMIVSPSVYKEILAELLWLDHMWNLDILCVIPQYTDIVQKKDVYNINRFLGYFRRKMISCDTPTIICNTCIGGRMYEWMDMPILSPFINSGFRDLDFVKMCSNIKHYMSCELNLLGWEKDITLNGSNGNVFVGLLDDIRIYFSHLDSDKMIAENWNLLRDRLNWNNILYIMEEQGYREPISKEAFDAFAKIDGKKLFVQETNYYEAFDKKPPFVGRREAPNRREPAIENFFDLVGFMNRG